MVNCGTEVLVFSLSLLFFAAQGASYPGGAASVFCLNNEMPCFWKLGVEAANFLVASFQASRGDNFLGRIRCHRCIPEHEEGRAIYFPTCADHASKDGGPGTSSARKVPPDCTVHALAFI